MNAIHFLKAVTCTYDCCRILDEDEFDSYLENGEAICTNCWNAQQVELCELHEQIVRQ